jgi:hypothetical protein
MRNSDPAEHSARMVLSILRDHNPPIGAHISLTSLTAEFRESLTEAELLAGLDYAGRQGWLVIDGSDIRVTEAGLRAVAG